MKAKVLKVCQLSVYAQCPFCGYDEWAAIDPYKMKRTVECDECGIEYEINIQRKGEQGEDFGRANMAKNRIPGK